MAAIIIVSVLRYLSFSQSCKIIRESWADTNGGIDQNQSQQQEQYEERYLITKSDLQRWLVHDGGVQWSNDEQLEGGVLSDRDASIKDALAQTALHDSQSLSPWHSFLDVTADPAIEAWRDSQWSQVLVVDDAVRGKRITRASYLCAHLVDKYLRPSGAITLSFFCRRGDRGSPFLDAIGALRSLTLQLLYHLPFEELEMPLEPEQVRQQLRTGDLDTIFSVFGNLFALAEYPIYVVMDNTHWFATDRNMEYILEAFFTMVRGTRVRPMHIPLKVLVTNCSENQREFLESLYPIEEVGSFVWL